MEVYESIFLTQEQHKKVEQEAILYTHLIYGLDPKWRSNHHCVSLVRDFTLFFYFEQNGLINPNMSMIYLLRSEAVQKMTSHPRLVRLKRVTENSLGLSILAAVQLSNVLLRILDKEIMPKLQLADLQLLEQFEQMDIHLLFSPEYAKYEDYPKQLVYVQTRIIRHFKEYLTNNALAFEEAIVKVVRFIDNYHLIEQDIFVNNRF